MRVKFHHKIQRSKWALASSFFLPYQISEHLNRSSEFQLCSNTPSSLGHFISSLSAAMTGGNDNINMSQYIAVIKTTVSVNLTEPPIGLLDFSDNFVLSSGIVTIDCNKGLVLLLYYRPKGEYLLPKGRKDIGESLQDAAIRETKEESGYNCQLLGHHLPTKTSYPATEPHTEPFAIQQRMNQGLRKIIFWYVAHVDSSDLPMGQSLEEGEDFEVRWVRQEVASETMSFIEDQKIVERALSALSYSVPDSAPLIPQLRECYLSPSINLRALGFLCISLGGSVIYGQQHVVPPQEIGKSTDWDGIGIVETKEDIVALISDFKPQLCALLWIAKEEYPNLKV